MYKVEEVWSRKYVHTSYAEGVDREGSDRPSECDAGAKPVCTDGTKQGSLDALPKVPN